MESFRVRRTASLFRSTPGFVVVASASGNVVEIGGSGAAIWAALPEPGEPPVEFGDLLTQLVAMHGITREVAERDATAVLQSLESIGCATRFP
jgi:hypothetical protein